MSKHELEAILELVNDQLKGAQAAGLSLAEIMELADSRRDLIAELKRMEAAA